MIHRALLGSIERFTGILIEHYEGNFPEWLAPTQLKIVTVGNVDEYLDSVISKLNDGNDWMFRGNYYWNATRLRTNDCNRFNDTNYLRL